MTSAMAQTMAQKLAFQWKFFSRSSGLLGEVFVAREKSGYNPLSFRGSSGDRHRRNHGETTPYRDRERR